MIDCPKNDDEEGDHAMPVTRWLHRVEDGIYLIVGVALSIAAAVLVGWAGWEFLHGALDGTVSESILQMLDRLLLVLMLVEIMHTVRISIGSRVLLIEPFLVVGLIAVIRRILIVTAEQAHAAAEQATELQMTMLELGILTFMILALVGAIYGVRRMPRRQRHTESFASNDTAEPSQTSHTDGSPGYAGGEPRR
jgi:uncharacterized membrane protein (DUF373 family)